MLDRGRPKGDGGGSVAAERRRSRLPTDHQYVFTKSHEGRSKTERKYGGESAHSFIVTMAGLSLLRRAAWSSAIRQADRQPSQLINPSVTPRKTVTIEARRGGRPIAQPQAKDLNCMNIRRAHVSVGIQTAPPKAGCISSSSLYCRRPHLSTHARRVEARP